MFSISSVSIYYGTQSDIQVKSYYRLNWLSACVFNFERLDILWDSIGHPSKKLLSFEFALSFFFQFRASRNIKGLNQTSELKFIVILICSEFPLSISSVLIYCGFNMLQASIFNFERLDVLRGLIRHPSKVLLSFEFATSIDF